MRREPVTTTAQNEADLRDALTRIRRAWLAPLARIRAVKPSIGGSGGSTAGWGLPLPAHVCETRRAAAATVYGWARVLIEDRDLRHARVADLDVPPMCDLLDRHATWLSGHDAIPDMIAELTTTATSLEAIAPPLRTLAERRPGERINADRRITIGTCALIVTARHTDETGRTWNVVDLDERHHGPQCASSVVARLDEWSGADATCRGCGTNADVTWWRDHVEPEQHVTIRRLVEVLSLEGVRASEKSIRRLIERDVLHVVALDERGRRLLDRQAAVQVVLERRRAIA